MVALDLFGKLLNVCINLADCTLGVLGTLDEAVDLLNALLQDFLEFPGRVVQQLRILSKSVYLLLLLIAQIIHGL